MYFSYYGHLCFTRNWKYSVNFKRNQGDQHPNPLTQSIYLNTQDPGFFLYKKKCIRFLDGWRLMLSENAPATSPAKVNHRIPGRL
jgi:hypothetical protein